MSEHLAIPAAPCLRTVLDRCDTVATLQRLCQGPGQTWRLSSVFARPADGSFDVEAIICQCPGQTRGVRMEPAEPPVARQISLYAVIQSILSHGPTSRADLAKRTGLSKQTISDVVFELETAGWLKPHGR